METLAQIEVDLTDEQIEELLQQAEARFETENPATKVRHRHAVTPHASSTLSKLPEPYVSTVGGVAKTDSHRLLAQKDRNLANERRKVGDPVLLKQKKLEVSLKSR